MNIVLDGSIPRYLPHRQHPQPLGMAMRALDPAQWLEIDNRLPEFFRHKQRLYAQDPLRVCRGLPESLPAQRELVQCLLEHLLQQYPQYYRRSDTGVQCTVLDTECPWRSAAAQGAAGDDALLWRASLLVAEDLLLMLPGDKGYVLAAASLCSPSHWRLTDKLGQPLRAIHAPVPGMARALDAKIDRFFERLKVEQPVERCNWSLQADPGLFHEERREQQVTAETPLYYRVERQTLRRLPDTGAIAFGIRVFLHPLSALAQVPGALPELWDAIDAASPEMAEYKGFDRLAPAIAGLSGRPVASVP